MFKKKSKNSGKRNCNFIPFSKKLLEYSRFECWVMTIALFVMQAMEIDTGELYRIDLAGWTGYAVAKALYYNMAKSDHQIQLLKRMDPRTSDKIKAIIIDDAEKKYKESTVEGLEDKKS